ncbi:hypothetical protein [[Flexibacter] sp. ATCC 35208]|uniref:hypothetical protein n=1 Tax=[Flexibacter] sp. ATCC 35208 TaxID=1936242 RepID=UPI0009C7AFFF|nr:hypothetical protein [[Flexibacter] sp. ATCC 35208]OMP80037.1 hypothetical protein BW716_05970 [[Flexibacter] sp. ATCC 35208]
MLKELTRKDFKNKYPGDYEDMLMKMDLESLNRMELQLGGILLLKIFSTGDKRFYVCVVDDSDNIDDIGDFPELRGTTGELKKYILSINACHVGEPEEEFDGSQAGLEKGEKEMDDYIEYDIIKKNRRAYLLFRSMQKNIYSEPLILVFIHAVTLLTDIDDISIRVCAEDELFVRLLREKGYSIGRTTGDMCTVTKRLR